LRQQFISENPDADDDEIEEQLKKMTDFNDIPHVTLNVENFYTPDQARKFANDVLHLGGISNPSSLMPIDYNFRRQTVQNDHCYTPLTMSPEPSEKSSQKSKSSSKSAKEQASTSSTAAASSSSKATNSGSSKKETKQAASKARQVAATVEDESSDSGDDDEEMGSGEEEEEEISFSESDDDNDMDFSVNDRFGKKGNKKKRKYRRHKQSKTNLTFKDFLEGSADMSSVDNDEPKKKYGKSPKKSASNTSSVGRSSSSGKSIGMSTPKNSQHQTSTTTPATPAMSSATKKFQLLQSQTKNSPLRKELPTNFNTPTATTPTPNASSNVQRNVNHSSAAANISHISIQSAAPAKSSQEIEFVESIVKDLEKSFPVNNIDKKQATQQQQLHQPTSSAATNSIPNIMQMMETNTPTEVIDQSLSTLEQMDSVDGPVGMDEIGDALIAVLGNEAIDELLNQGDLMNFDATTPATTNSNAIVKSTLNVVSSTTPNVLIQQQHQLPISLSDVSSSLLTSQIPKILNKQAPAKDPIKVVRNGRVITLPPIEAPATRGAKRRAQGDSASTSPVGKVEIVKIEKSPSVKDSDSKNSSRRSSINKSESGKNSRRQSTAQLPNEEDDVNSDASWNSEDDPDRLWCICKQPHNNRFMICCDKCEEWFHGTCVNVTKAMGKEIERQKKKWLCPKCKTSVGSITTSTKDPNNKKTLNQQKLTKFFNKNQKESGDEDDLMKTSSGAILCAVCHLKPARTDSIYCSENCIRNHATKHLDDSSSSQPKSPMKSDQTKRGNVLKDQSGNVSFL
jgi:hypothetical protein